MNKEAKTNPKIILIAGCNGAGKSTLAPHLLRDTFWLTDYVNADTIAQGLSASAPEKVAFEAGRVLAIRRVEERVKLGGHSIEVETIRRRYMRGLKNFFELYQPLADSRTVYDNSAAGNPILIADKQTGDALQIHDTLLWEKICELKNQ